MCWVKNNLTCDLAAAHENWQQETFKLTSGCKSNCFPLTSAEVNLKVYCPCSLCRGQKPASKCIRLVYEILVRCRALQALYTPQRCELVKTKTNNINCSYRIFIVCRSPVSPVFWARILLTNFCLSRVRVHRFRDKAVTGDIPLISPVLESMVPP